MRSLQKLMFEFGCNYVVRYWRSCIVWHSEENQLTPSPPPLSLFLWFSDSLQRRAAANPVLTSSWLLDTKHLRVRWVTEVSISIIILSGFILVCSQSSNEEVFNRLSLELSVTECFPQTVELLLLFNKEMKYYNLQHTLKCRLHSH